MAVNPAMEDAPEIINQDPYGEGWLVMIKDPAWEADRSKLLNAEAYFKSMKAEADEEIKNQ